MPMVADIRRNYPDAHIDWVVEEAYTSLVRLNPLVRNIIPIALRRWRKSLGSVATRAEIVGFYRQLRHDAYDLVFDTQGLLKTSVVMRMARLAPGGKRVGLANATEGSGYEPLSRIFHTQSVAVGLHTHAVMRARAAKQWPAEHWIAVAQALSKKGLPVLLPWGSAKEKAAAESLAAHMPQATVLPALPLMEAVLLVHNAALVVGLDTGLTHIAAAYCRPTVEIYCDSPRWKTEGNWSPRVANVGDTGAAPDVAQVLAAIDAVLSVQAAAADHGGASVGVA